MHWVGRGTGTPKDKDEVNKREDCECEGWVWDLDVIDVPSRLRLIRKAAALARIFPTLDLSIADCGKRTVHYESTCRLRGFTFTFIVRIIVQFLYRTCANYCSVFCTTRGVFLSSHNKIHDTYVIVLVQKLTIIHTVNVKVNPRRHIRETNVYRNLLYRKQYVFCESINIDHGGSTNTIPWVGDGWYDRRPWERAPIDIVLLTYVYYESRKRELKTKLIYENRGNERLKN
jgi:hypothetical protein